MGLGSSEPRSRQPSVVGGAAHGRGEGSISSPSPTAAPSEREGIVMYIERLLKEAFTLEEKLVNK